MASPFLDRLKQGKHQARGWTPKPWEVLFASLQTQGEIKRVILSLFSVKESSPGGVFYQVPSIWMSVGPWALSATWVHLNLYAEGASASPLTWEILMRKAVFPNVFGSWWVNRDEVLSPFSGWAGAAYFLLSGGPGGFVSATVSRLAELLCFSSRWSSASALWNTFPFLFPSSLQGDANVCTYKFHNEI